MMSRLKQIIFVSIISLQLVSFFIPQLSRAQVVETTTNPNILEPQAPVVDPYTQTTTEYNPNQVIPNNEPAGGSAGGSILRNLWIFGQGLGMSATDPRTILARLIRMALSFVGIIVLVLILWSGLSYMTAGGDEERAANARKTFFNTLIGLVIILMAYSIVTFVLKAFTGTVTTPDPAIVPTQPAINSDPVVNP